MDRYEGWRKEVIVELSDRGSVYIRYRVGELPVGDTLEVGGDATEVLADVNEAGDVIGIEIVDVNVAESVELARAFAHERRLAFPRDIVAAARSASAA
jgi:uncharacterized protein YuzE